MPGGAGRSCHVIPRAFPSVSRVLAAGGLRRGPWTSSSWAEDRGLDCMGPTRVLVLLDLGAVLCAWRGERALGDSGTMGAGGWRSSLENTREGGCRAWECVRGRNLPGGPWGLAPPASGCFLNSLHLHGAPHGRSTSLAC